MQKIKCELCGSNQLLKQDGFFICEYCRTKYSVEDAKKMLIEGVVEVTGTVKMDSSEKLKNLYQIARRAKNDNNAESAAKHYEMILVEDPNSWEAVFYTVYYKAFQCSITEIQSAAISVSNCIHSVFELIKNNVSEEAKQEEAIEEVTSCVIYISDIFLNSAKNYFNELDSEIKHDFTQQFIANAAASVNTIYYLGDSLDVFFNDKKFACELMISAWKSGIVSHLTMLDTSLVGFHIDKNNEENVIMTYVDKIKKYDSSYQSPNVNIKSNIGYIIMYVVAIIIFVLWIISQF